jgi:hypothetical protein
MEAPLEEWALVRKTMDSVGTAGPVSE